MDTKSDILARYPITVRDGFGFFFHESCPLSNWFKATTTVKDKTFRTNEHFMMYCKAMLFGDTATAAKILVTKTAKDAKARGREVSNYDDRIWVARRVPIVATGAKAKFLQHPRLLEFFLATEGLALVEASKYDKIWGIGLSADDPRATDRTQWPGQDLLGGALTKLRDHMLQPKRSSSPTI